MDCTKCSYRVKCCPTCGTSLETEGREIAVANQNNVIIMKHTGNAIISLSHGNETARKDPSTAETFSDGTKIKSHDDCSSLSDNTTTQDSNEYRMVVFGLPSSGVSATANTILGDKFFQEGVTFDGTTTECKMESRKRFGYVLKVVDTPGFVFDKKMRSAEELFPGLLKSIMLLPPGPHIVLVTLPLDRINEDLHHMIHCLKCFENLSRHVIVILTKIDKIGKDRAGWKQEIFESENLSELLEFCGNRVAFFDNTSNSEQQVKELLDVMIKVVEGNMSEFFNTAFFSQKSNKNLELVLQDHDNSKTSVLERINSFWRNGK